MHPVTFPLSTAASVLLASVLAAPTPASAQSAAAFTAWGQSLGKTVHQCPTTPVPLPPKPQPPPPQNNSNPNFGFNGTTSVSSFACQQVGWFDLSGGHWFMQNIQGLLPPSCAHPQPSCRVNTVRVCSWNRIGSSSNAPGPFGGTVGPFGCEKLWSEEFPSP
jgi:hypothetical protein